MPTLDFYPAVVAVAIAVAWATSQFAGIPMDTALVLLLAGVAVSGFIAYRPVTSASADQVPVQRLVQRVIARALRLTIGTVAIALATVSALYYIGQVSS